MDNIDLEGSNETSIPETETEAAAPVHTSDSIAIAVCLFYFLRSAL